MKEKAKAMLLASFASDSLALGVHWIYNTNVIDKKFGRVEHLVKPIKQSYHKTKDKGEFTHYGDQTLVLLESIALNQGFDLKNFAKEWQEFLQDYTGYIDQATKTTLANFQSGQNETSAGSHSTDLGGAARIAPLVCYYADDLGTLVAGARAQTAMTHNHPDVIATAEFFARATYQVLNGSSPIAALESVVKEDFCQNTPLGHWVAEGLESSGQDTREAILAFGQMCEIEAAFPATIHLIAKYEDNFKNALVEDAMAGGDSAARGLLAGMMLGAYHGLNAIPQDWLTDMTQYQRISDLIGKLD